MSVVLGPLGRTQAGALELNFSYRDGKTVLGYSHHKTPLHFVRPFEIDGDGLMVFIINPTAGVMGGDTFEIKVNLGSGAKVVLLTQTANKIHRMDVGREGVQQVEVNVAKGARLEYYPERTIPFEASSYRQMLVARLEQGAEFSIAEGFSSGRVSSGEEFLFENFSSETKVFRDQKLIYLDRFELHPQTTKVSRLGIMAAHNFYTAGFFTGNAPAFDTPNITYGDKTVLGDSWFRGSAHGAPELDVEVRSRVNHLRQNIFGCGALTIRR